MVVTHSILLEHELDVVREHREEVHDAIERYPTLHQSSFKRIQGALTYHPVEQRLPTKTPCQAPPNVFHCEQRHQRGLHPKPDAGRDAMERRDSLQHSDQRANHNQCGREHVDVERRLR